MFINSGPPAKLALLNRAGIILFVLLAIGFSLSAQQKAIRGLVVEQDSSTVMPFVYVISKTSGNGTMSDHTGHFTLIAGENDTLLCSYIGFFKKKFPVAELKMVNGAYQLVMKRMPFELQEVTVSSFSYKPYEREYMKDIIDRSKMRTISAFQSPITALYMQYSKEGRQVRKLAKIFEQLLIDEQVEKKLNRDILEKLTGDKDIDFEAFRKYCYYVSDEFIINHEGADLYTAIMDCYKKYKRENRARRPVQNN
jgi:hypothetical protein